LIKHPIPNARWVDKSRAAWRRECERDPDLPALLPVAGKVEAKGGAVRVTLLTADNGKVVYTAIPVGGWRFALDYYEYSRAPASAPFLSVAAFEAEFQRIKQMSDTALTLLADLDGQLRAFEAHAAEAKYLPSNVVHLSNIAAE
jgi:hypothetical protein